MSLETDSPKNHIPDDNKNNNTDDATVQTKSKTPTALVDNNNNNNNNNKDDVFQIQDDWTLISQGAEAKIWKIPHYLISEGGGDGDCLAKQRFSKSYRHPLLDERLTKARCKSEVKCLVKCRRGGVPCPAIYGVVPPVIYMEFIQGQTVRSYLDQRVAEQSQSHHDTTNNHDNHQHHHHPPPNNHHHFFKLAKAMGDLIGRVHNLGVIHGDLTTSNMMLQQPPPQPQDDDPHNTSTKEPSSSSRLDDNDNDIPPKLIMIDFGLARVSNNPEELAVDLYVLERALISTHPELSFQFVEHMLAAYKATSTKSHQVLHRLGQVRLRGRKRECFG